MKLEKNYYVFSLSYVGARFFGWQKQRDFPSLHQAFNTALEKALFDTLITDIKSSLNPIPMNKDAFSNLFLYSYKLRQFLIGLNK